MARSLAILLMLEGHFVDVALAPEWRRPGYWPYEIWYYLRGLAAPMFFTGTGLVFAYLLTAGHEPQLWKIKRIRKGLVRALELLFWGYLLQLDARRLPEFLRGDPGSWFQAFHVLQCIGVGLFIMMAGYGLLRHHKPQILATAYVIAGLFLYVMHVWLAGQPGHVPAAGPEWFQNMWKGTYSVFPLAPWLGFTMYGAAVGVWVRWRGASLWHPSAALTLIGIGLALRIAGILLDRYGASGLLYLSGISPEFRPAPDWFHGRVGEVLMILGLLVAYEARFRPADSWFLNIGRNTFSIYVVHVIILYGGIFGLGLNKLIGHSLNLWQSITGALVFVAFFAGFAQWIGPLARWWKGRASAIAGAFRRTRHRPAP